MGAMVFLVLAFEPVNRNAWTIFTKHKKCATFGWWIRKQVVVPFSIPIYVIWLREVTLYYVHMSTVVQFGMIWFEQKCVLLIEPYQACMVAKQGCMAQNGIKT